MAISTIAHYSLPTDDALPNCRAPWKLEPARAVLLVHDMQRYFLAPFASESASFVALIDNVRRLLRAARALRMPVVFSAQPREQSRAERGLLWDLWGPGIVEWPDLAGFRDDIAPDPGDCVVTKKRYSAFYETELADVMTTHGRQQLVVCGVYAHIGCFTTAVDGFMRGFQPFVVADGVADFSEEDHRVALRQVARTCGVVISTRSVLDAAHEQLVRGELASLLPHAERIPPDDDLADHGLDSLRAMLLLERVLPLQHGLSFEALVEARTIRKLATLLNEQDEVGP